MPRARYGLRIITSAIDLRARITTTAQGPVGGVAAPYRSKPESEGDR